MSCQNCGIFKSFCKHDGGLVWQRPSACKHTCSIISGRINVNNWRQLIIFEANVTHNSVWIDLLVLRASANCFVRVMLDTTPRFRLSCARECDSATPRHTRPKSRSENWQPLTDNSRTVFSFRLSQMSFTSAPERVSPVIWIEPGSILAIVLAGPTDGQINVIDKTMII